MSEGGALFWVTTKAIKTMDNGDKINVAYAVRAPFDTVEDFADALNAGKIVNVKRIDRRDTIAISAAAVASVAFYTKRRA